METNGKMLGMDLKEETNRINTRLLAVLEKAKARYLGKRVQGRMTFPKKLHNRHGTVRGVAILTRCDAVYIGLLIDWEWLNDSSRTLAGYDVYERCYWQTHDVLLPDADSREEE